MLNLVIEDLRSTGVDARLSPGPNQVDAILELTIEGRLFRLAIETRSRAPFPGELDQLLAARESLGEWGTPTLVVPYVSDSVGKLLIPFGWSWADEAGNYDLSLGQGTRLRRRRVATPPKPRRRDAKLPQGSGALAIIRFLILEDAEVPLRTTDLATIAGVTTARASQVMNHLQGLGLVEKTGRAWSPDRKALLDSFLKSYRGPGGSQTWMYSLDPPADTVVRIVRSVGEELPQGRRLSFSADVGPDLIVPWRRPEIVIVYVDDYLELNVQGLVPVEDPTNGNVLIRRPDDQSVFRHRPLTSDLGEVEIPLADESQMIWDLQYLGGDDRMEAAENLRSWLLKSR